uniref:Uncharacterized protein LOC105633093 n=1 Tax=Rhizophora mucronata TaxID=61149 RepID=A0A2P2JZC4_RHIMU
MASACNIRNRIRNILELNLCWKTVNKKSKMKHWKDIGIDKETLCNWDGIHTRQHSIEMQSITLNTHQIALNETSKA